jgi:V/A-type H+-transporting ATPase subunit A
LAEIVGAASLPGHERMVLLGGRLLRDGVLLQSDQSPNDAFCIAEKGAALLKLVLDVVDTCQRLVERGVAAATIEQTNLVAVARAREETGPEDAAGVASRGREIIQRLEELR